jgi:DMSO/TMAO reductase YedYZ molybdopterin-dependent catalytic subunit
MTKQNEELPPKQELAIHIWPYVGERTPKSLGEGEVWRVSVVGLVDEERTWTIDELRAMPQVEQTVDIHCVTRWSKPGAHFSGVPLSRLLEECHPRPEARFASFVARSERNHSTSLVLEDAMGLGALVTLGYEGRELGDDHGGPVRMVVPGRYFYKSVKWLERIELLAEDRLGYWEKDHGYHNVADSWRQQRYIVPEGRRQEVREALQKKDFRGKHFLSIDASGHDLTGLKAEDALLRNANFQGVNLEGANFNGANLTNASLNGANLRDATFVGADVEGADFTGADLRGADFTGASLFGTTFCARDFSSPALLDGSTYFDEAALGRLLSPQQEFVRRATGR